MTYPSVKYLLISVSFCTLIFLQILESEATEPKTDPFDLKATLTLEDARKLSAHPPLDTQKQHPSSEQRLVIALPLSFDFSSLVDLSLGEINLLGLVIKESSQFMNGNPLVEDFHAYSNLRAEDRVEMFELYWSKNWGTHTVRIGKLDANDHFAVSEHEAMLINGAAGFSPSILGMPSYPDSAWSVQATEHLNRFDLSLAVFDGASTTLRPTPTGARFWWSDEVRSGGVFYIGQVSAHLGPLDSITSVGEIKEGKEVTSFQQDRDFEARSPLHITLGAWTHRGEIVLVKGEPKSASGIFLTSDFKLMQTSKGGELGLGAQLALTSYLVPLHASLAITLSEITQPIAWAQSGLSFALGGSYIRLSEQSGGKMSESSESLVEATFAAPLSPSLKASVSLVFINGEHLNSESVKLIVSRLTLGTF